MGKPIEERFPIKIEIFNITERIIWNDGEELTLNQYKTKNMNATITPIRHKDVNGTDLYYIQVEANNKKTIVTIGKGALEKIETTLKEPTVKK